MEEAERHAREALSILDKEAGPSSDPSLITLACLVRVEASKPRPNPGLDVLLTRAKGVIGSGRERGGALSHLSEEVWRASMSRTMSNLYLDSTHGPI